MKKRSVVVTTGTRADYGILRPILDEIKNSKKLDLKLIVTGSHFLKEYGMTVNQIKKDGYQITAKIPITPKTDSKLELQKFLVNLL